MRLTLASAAGFELMDATNAYEATRPRLGREFLEQVDRVCVRLQRHPYMAPVVAGEFRRAVVSRFPYCLVYRVCGSEVQVIAVLPTRADPQRLFDRIASAMS